MEHRPFGSRVKRRKDSQRRRAVTEFGGLALRAGHDVKNALSVIEMYADLIANNADDPDVVRDHAERIGEAARRGATITNGLIARVRSETGREDPPPPPGPPGATRPR